MPKRVPTVSTVVIRKIEGSDKTRRVPVQAGKPFDFTTKEIDDLNRIHPGALRKLVNENDDGPNESAGTAETAPEKTVKPTATKANGKAAAKKAAEKDSTSDEATGNTDDTDADSTDADEDEDI